MNDTVLVWPFQINLNRTQPSMLKLYAQLFNNKMKILIQKFFFAIDAIFVLQVFVIGGRFN